MKTAAILPTYLSNLEAAVVNGDDFGGGFRDGSVKPRLEQKRALGIPLYV